MPGGALPPQGLERIAGIAGDGGRVLRVHPMAVRFANHVCRIEVVTRSGLRETFVLKRYAVAQDMAKRRVRAESAALTLAGAAGIPVPGVLLPDDSGHVFGLPGLLTTFMTGAQVLDSEDPAQWARQLGSMLARIHSVSLDPTLAGSLFDGNVIGTWFLRNEADASYRSRHPLGTAVIEHVRRLYSSHVPDRRSLLHVDYWPGNVLWHRGKISCVLDWEEASLGDAALDVGYMRMDMSLRGLNHIADEFLAVYETESGRRVPGLGLWELASAVRSMPEPDKWTISWRALGDLRSDSASIRAGLSEFVRVAMRRSG